MPFLNVFSRVLPPRWLLPALLGSAIAIAGSVVTLALVFAQIDGIERDVEAVSVEGTHVEEASVLDIAADDLLVFVAQERLRAALGDTGPIPLAALVDASARVVTIETTVPLLSHDGETPAPAPMALAEAFLSYVNGRDPAALPVLEAELEKVEKLSEELRPVHQQAALDHFLGVDAHGDRLRTISWILAVTLVPATVAGIFFFAISNHGALKVALERGRSLEASNATLERRNQQFQGLYQVVTEVTETLSLKYVVETTVRETRSLVDADIVILRTLQDGLLILAGTTGGDQCHFQEDIELGTGVVGRVAKRAKILQTLPAESREFLDPAACGMQSGVVLPLIVGARVVGTVSCWSAETGHFTDDDVRVLELMASQVATAIAAADVHEERGRQAYLDPLTQLPNRRQLTQDVRFEYDSAVRRGRPMAVAMIDVDHFKAFNDTYGHHAGDIALQRVAAALASGVRREDRVYRYGGEEFAIILDSLGRAAALEACERLRSLVAAARDGAEGPRVTISIGLALPDQQAEDFTELLLAADEALYAAKESGRDRVVVAGGIATSKSGRPAAA